jgi:hypothetical protein
LPTIPAEETVPQRMQIALQQAMSTFRTLFYLTYEPTAPRLLQAELTQLTLLTFHTSCMAEHAEFSL